MKTYLMIQITIALVALAACAAEVGGPDDIGGLDDYSDEYTGYDDGYGSDYGSDPAGYESAGAPRQFPSSVSWSRTSGPSSFGAMMWKLPLFIGT